jgi:hypothetical protein
MEDEIAALDLPERVKSHLRELAATNAPVGWPLMELLNGLPKQDVEMQTGLCWYVSRAKVTKQECARLAPCLERFLESDPASSWHPVVDAWPVIWCLIIAAQTMGSRFQALALGSATLFFASTCIWRWHARRRFRMAVARLGQKAQVYALRALTDWRATPPIALAARLAANAPDWLRPDAEAALRIRLIKDRDRLRHEWSRDAPQTTNPTGLPQSQQFAASAMEIRRVRRLRRTLILGGALLAGAPFVLATAAIYSEALGFAIPRVLPNLLLGGVIGSFLGGFVAILIGILAQPAMPVPVAALAAEHGPAIAGVLAEATRALAPALTSEVKAALADVLPQVRASDRNRYTPLQRQCFLDLLVGPWSRAGRMGRRRPIGRLMAALARPFGYCTWRLGSALPSGGHERDIRLQVAILQALMHIGDAGDLAAVRLVVSRTRNRPDLAVVHAAARECLTIIEDRARLLDDTDLLLRPADPADASTLLRPAMRAPATPDGLLVRPAEEDMGPGSVEGIGQTHCERSAQ